ncbi:RagB/SusD family nutrient uptake outer membrane protein [Chitinophaga sp. Hz27]|uniref:RagB/SusD family nutrient uptake outer membrane protein n=1 Tax=Chitinophaga sp. Hz27 TaxID=3347169 RepID=UPI0035DC73E3
MKKLILLLLGTLSLMSCKKFLREYSQTEVIPKTAADFGEILYTEGYPVGSQLLQPWMVYLTDDVQCYFAPFIAGEAGTARDFYQWQPNFDNTAPSKGYPTVDTWEAYYRVLLGANVALQYLDKSIGTQAEKDQYKGEAYTLRAFYHFMLVNIYGRPYNDSTTTPEKSPGIPLRLSANLSDQYLARSTVKEVYEQVEKDLDSAIYLMELHKSKVEDYRISYLAAHLLASRVYLYEEKWDQAIGHAAVVIRDHPQLMNYNEWIGIDDIFTKPLTGRANIETIWCYGNVNEQSLQPYGTCYNISHDLANCFEPADLRSQIAIQQTPDELKSIFAFDYSSQKNMTGGLNSDNGLTNTWRSAEAYLNMAEAYIQLYRTKGDGPAGSKGLQALNTLRQGRFMPADFKPWTLLPASEMLDSCRAERRRELYVEECHRWFDLRRYGMPSITHAYLPAAGVTEYYKLQRRDPQYIMSIPQSAMTRNPALTPNPTISGLRKAE